MSSYRRNAGSSTNEMNKTREWLPKLDFILHVGMYDEDSAAFADVVLPVCSKFEDTVEHSIVRGGYNHIQLSQKCIDPLFESKPDYDVMYLIAKSVGLESVLPEDAEHLARFQIDEATDPMVAGITFDALVQNQYDAPGGNRGAAHRVRRSPIPHADGAYGDLLRAPAPFGPGASPVGGEQRGLRRQSAHGKVSAAACPNPHAILRALPLSRCGVARAVHTPRIEPNRRRWPSAGFRTAMRWRSSTIADRSAAAWSNAIRPRRRASTGRVVEGLPFGNPQNVMNDHVNERDADLSPARPFP
ncbi:MAG: molybdopterin-dependent oxidoreductase [Adlercreutzia sp.]